MSITTSSTVFIPEVIGDIADSVLEKKTPLLASGYVTNAQPMALYPGSGRDVTFITWEDPEELDFNYLVTDMVGDSRTGVNSYAFKQGTYVETLKEKTISFDVDQSIFTDMQTDLNEYYADLIAKKTSETIQRDLLDRAEETNLSLDVTGESTKTLTIDAILRARMKWGEQANNGIPALFCHSNQYSDLAQTSEFRTMATSFRDSIGSSDINNPGPVAMVHGVQIWLCDSITVTSGSPDSYTAVMLLPKAIGLYLKETKVTPPIRHAGSRVITLDYHFRWASTLYREAPRRVVKLITQ